MSERVAEILMANRDRAISDAWSAMLRSTDGRLVMWSILERCHLFSQTHVGTALDGFRAGMRDIGLHILNDRIFPHDVRTFANMQVEHAEMMQRLQLAAEQEAEKETSDE